jgi:hypothetical protein
LTNHISDILLYQKHWFLLEPRKEQIFGLLLIAGWKLEPEVSDDFAHVNARNLSNVLVW